MYLTDLSFLFIFLPAVLIAAAMQPKWKNAALLLLSLFFYACGSPACFLLFVAGIVLNVLLAYVIQALREKSRELAACVLILGIGLDVNCLLHYKYFDFVMENISGLLHLTFTARGLLLPMGISFFVFKAISLLADVYCGRAVLGKNPVDTALYLSFFGQVEVVN